MGVFNIFPSEALLIGCCVGEYLAAKQDNDHANFLYFLLKRLRPFVPSLEQETTTNLPDTHPVLEDIDWQSFGEIGHIGFSDTDPTCVFRKHAETITMTTWDCSRKSLIDLLYDLVEPFVVKSLREIFQMPALCQRRLAFEVEPGYRETLDLCCQGCYDADGVLTKSLSVYQTPRHTDDTPSLIGAIETLIAHNRFQDEYDVGRLFGGVFAELERWNLGICQQVNPRGFPHDTLITEYRDGRLLWNAITGEHAEDSGGDKVGTNDAEERYRSSVGRLASHKYVQGCLHAEMILRAGHTLSVTSANPLCTEVSEFCEARAIMVGDFRARE
jgi:hypothetical protein